MLAALIKAFGEPTEVLELADVPEPSGPAAGQVLVGVEYAPINMNDVVIRRTADQLRQPAAGAYRSDTMVTIGASSEVPFPCSGRQFR